MGEDIPTDAGIVQPRNRPGTGVSSDDARTTDTPADSEFYPGSVSRSVWAKVKAIDAIFKINLNQGADRDRVVCESLQQCFDLLAKETLENSKDLKDCVQRSEIQNSLLEIAVALGWLAPPMAPSNIAWVHREWLMRLLEGRIAYFESCLLGGTSGNIDKLEDVVLKVPETNPLFQSEEALEEVKKRLSQPPKVFDVETLKLHASNAYGTPPEKVTPEQLEATIDALMRKYGSISVTGNPATPLGKGDRTPQLNDPRFVRSELPVPEREPVGYAGLAVSPFRRVLENLAVRSQGVEAPTGMAERAGSGSAEMGTHRDLDLTLEMKRSAEPPPPLASGSEAGMPARDPEDVSDTAEEGWGLIRRADWREDAALALKCPALLRPVKAARLDAIATLRKEAAAAVQSALPQTKQQLELCLWPAFSEYAEDVFDKIAEAELSVSGPGGRREAYGRWLRSECSPAVVDDVCRPIFGQFPITVRHVVEIIGERQSPEIESTRRALWGMLTEVLGGPFTENLSKCLSTHLEGRRPHWEAKATQPRPATVAKAKKPVRRNAKYERIDEALRELAEARPKNHREVFRLLDDRKVSIPNRKPFKAAGGWLKGFDLNRHTASAWLSQAWGKLSLPSFPRGPKK